MSDEECIFCFDPLTSEKPVTLTCGHAYHLNCLRRYIHRSASATCPFCRATIQLNDVMLSNTPISTINNILPHLSCIALTQGGRGHQCTLRAYPGNHGKCQKHRQCAFNKRQICTLAQLLTKEFRLNFYQKVALYDLYFAALDRYRERYSDGTGFYEDYQTCLHNATHYRHVYRLFELPYPGDDYYQEMARHRFNCKDVT